ncbi:unnamed protein product [Lampetra planeri]
MQTDSGNILKKHAADQERRASSPQSVSVAKQMDEHTDEHTTKSHYEPCSDIFPENCGSRALSFVHRDGDLASAAPRADTLHVYSACASARLMR